MAARAAREAQDLETFKLKISQQDDDKVTSKPALKIPIKKNDTKIDKPAVIIGSSHSEL
jgi:hypothetical protein